MKRSLLLMVCALAMVFASTATAQDEPEAECVSPPGVIDPAPYYVGVGDAHAASALHGQAIIDYTCAIQVTPDYAPAYARRALSHTALGDGDAALEDFNAALALDETLIEAYINRGMFYTQAGNFGLALADFSLVIGLDPDNVTALNNRAVVHAIENNFDLALDDLAQAIMIEPENAALYATQAGVYSALAAQSYQQFLAVSGSDRARLPAGTPTQVLTAVDDSLRTGNYGIWLALLRQGN